MPQTPRQSHPHVTGGHSLFHRPGTAIPLGQANGDVSQPSFLQHLAGGASSAKSFQTRKSSIRFSGSLSLRVSWMRRAVN
jgi:hypothetical protein